MVTSNKTPKYNIGDVVIANDKFNHAEGRITAISESTGTVPGFLYRVFGKTFTEDAIKTVCSHVEDTPDSYYEQMQNLKETMRNDIYSLVLAYGKRRDLSDNRTEYTVTFNSKNDCFVTYRDGKNYKVKSVIVINSPDYHRGYLFVNIQIDKKIEQTSFETGLTDQEFNVYSPLFRMLYK